MIHRMRVTVASLLLLPVLAAPSLAQQPPLARAPMEPGKWVVSQSNEEPKTDAERKSMCSNPVAWVEISDKSWIEGDSGGRRVCAMPKWTAKGTTYRAPPLKCKPAAEADGDGNGSVSVLVKGPNAVEINNALFVRCN
ncbi:hypothetical protein [Xanthobacter sp. KR7-225]|uniref:hypothetical protein n=1 Tax=Xanthobacter sp. KR7-225 TaxID=3156613 RepID=UPI0032B5A299